MSNIGRDLLNVPMGEMIREMAFAIADAQYELDQASVHVAQMIKMSREIERTTTTNSSRDNYKKSSSFFGRLFGSKTKVGTTTVDATYSSKYNYSAEGASLLRCNLVPIPAPAMFEERVRALLDNDNPSDET